MKWCGVLTLVLGLAAGAAHAQVPVPKAERIDNKPTTVVSLSRARPEWRVVTSIDLVVTPIAAQPGLTYTVGPVGHGTLTCPRDASGKVAAAAGTRSVTCTYEPNLRWVGQDSFVWQATYEGGGTSEPEPVTIDVRERGLRWEFKANGSTIRSESATESQLASIPDIVGGSAQDFLFTLNWQTMSPRQRLRTKLAEGQRTASATGALPAAVIAETTGKKSRSQNLLIETGVETDTVSSTVVDVGGAATTRTTGAAATATEEKPVARRNLVMRGEWNANLALDSDGQGGFVELGVLARGGLSTVLESNESFVEAAGRVLQVIPKDRTAFRVDAGVRLALKQSHESKQTSVITGPDQLERATNIEDFATFEAGFRFDSGQGDAPVKGADDRRRGLVVRASVYPHAALAGHQLGMFGIEATKPTGGTLGVKVLYGVNLSASRGIFSKDGE